MGDRWLIGELARRAGLSAKTVRYYESFGLLSEAVRTESGYRTYAGPDLERLRFITGAKALGLTLAEIKGVLAGWNGGERPCNRVSALLDRKLAELDRQIHDLTRFRDELRAYKSRVDAQPTAAGVPCPHVAGVNEGEFAPEAAAPPGDLALGACRAHTNVGLLRLVKAGPE
jgi:DNA-binding transcriptional MerR regulator